MCTKNTVQLSPPKKKQQKKQNTSVSQAVRRLHEIRQIMFISVSVSIFKYDESL